MAIVGAKNFKRIQARTVPITENKNKGYVSYGRGNSFPQDWVKDLSESGTATLCIEKLNSYTYAYGLVDPATGKLPVNKNQTLNELIEEQTEYATTFRGVAYHIKRFPTGKIAEVTTIPFEEIREGCDGNYIVNCEFGKKKYKKEDDIVLVPFKGAEYPFSEIDPIPPFGEILYFFKKRPMMKTYPIPPAYSGVEDINTDSENSKYELESVTNSFLPGGILQKTGAIDTKTEDDSGKTEMDHIENSLLGFTGGAKDETGASGRQSLLFLHSPTKDEGYTYTPISNEGTLNAIDKSTLRITDKVCRLFSVPPFLVGMGGNTGFAKEVVSDNIVLFNDSIDSIQNLILTPLKKIYPGIADKLVLTKKNPVRFLPPELLAQLTPDEIRGLYDFKPLPKPIQIPTTPA